MILSDLDGIGSEENMSFLQFETIIFGHCLFYSAALPEIIGFSISVSQMGASRRPVGSRLLRGSHHSNHHVAAPHDGDGA